jgi:hypothetical protein
MSHDAKLEHTCRGEQGTHIRQVLPTTLTLFKESIRLCRAHLLETFGGRSGVADYSTNYFINTKSSTRVN